METIEISPFFALDAEELIFSGDLAEARELCLMGVTSYPDYPAGYCVLADIYWECGEYDKSYEILEKASLLFPGNRAVAAKIELFAEKARELSVQDKPINDIVESSGIGIPSAPDDNEDDSPSGIELSLTEEPEEITIVDETLYGNETPSEIDLSLTEEPEEITIVDETLYGNDSPSEIDLTLTEEPEEITIVDEALYGYDTNPLYFRKNFIRDLPFSTDHFRKNDLLRARNLSLIPGLESSPLIPSNSIELQRNYIEDFLILPNPSSAALDKVKQLKLRNNQQSNLDVSLFDDRMDDDDNDVRSVSPVMTETLAKIYESQQLWATAISAYEILAERNPANAELYLQKIAKLKEKI